jgi:DNA-binding beta-propeller fold protein YncE
VYLAVDGTGRVLVTDRLQHAVLAYDSEGNYLDTLLGPDLTLSEYVAAHTTGFEPGDMMAYNLFEQAVYYRPGGGSEQTLAPPGPVAWAPLGVRVDGQGNLLLTDVSGDRHAVRQIPGDAMGNSWRDFEPAEIEFGNTGVDGSELTFPNAAVVDSLDRVYVTDGNNGRVSVWDRSGDLLFSFGQGAGEAALSLPRGAAIDAKDRLHVVDAVQQSVKVYDVSGADARFLFTFGDWGAGDGQFDYPNDIALDATGRLYIADRENNRVQVWSY